jgi:hypothetical protein
MSALVVSLDFELFWGVTESRTIENYGENIQGVWQALPGILELFQRYQVHATWATVGMLMCKDFKHWTALKPDILPTYARERCLTYSFSNLAKEFPKLFFAPELVEKILSTDGQELASHTYSHFYCGEETTSINEFLADLQCVKTIFNEYGVSPTSLVFPRNQVIAPYLTELYKANYIAYRGNQKHSLYINGQLPSSKNAKIKRLVKFADSYLPLTGNHTYEISKNNAEHKNMLDIPASMFLRPLTNHPILNSLHLERVKSAMLDAAINNKIFHLWWHPHNFGKNTQANLNNLEKLLKYFQFLKQKYAMNSYSMAELANIIL